VLQDCADKSGRNWFVYFDEVSDTYGLWYDKASSLNYVCTLSFSNVDGDADNDLIWWMNPGSPTEAQDPGKIVSGVRAVYTGGEVFRHASDIGLTTATDFYLREQTAPSANTKSAAKASAMADRLLRDNDEEEVGASFSVLLPSTKVGLVRAGMRVSCRFEHFDPPYRDWTDWRILRLETAQDEPNLGWYNLKLDVTPIDTPPCPDPTPSGTFYPLGGSGSTSNPSPGDGNVMYWKAGNVAPLVPTPGHQGDWNFPRWGAGGIGTVDGAGDCAQNFVRIAVTGPGTMTIHTSVGDTHVCPLGVDLYYAVGAFPAFHSSVEGNAGDDLVIAVPASEWCDWYAELTDRQHDCGGSWNFTGVDWVAGE
jgi:hypothetical protein